NTEDDAAGGSKALARPYDEAAVILFGAYDEDGAIDEPADDLGVAHGQHRRAVDEHAIVATLGPSQQFAQARSAEQFRRIRLAGAGWQHVEIFETCALGEPRGDFRRGLIGQQHFGDARTLAEI